MEPSTDPAVFLAAALTAATALAQAAGKTGTTWHAYTDRTDENDVAAYAVVSTPGEYIATAGGLDATAEAVVSHIAAHDPQAVERDTAADRGILEAYEKAVGLWGAGSAMAADWRQAVVLRARAYGWAGQ